MEQIAAAALLENKHLAATEDVNFDFPRVVLFGGIFDQNEKGIRKTKRSLIGQTDGGYFSQSACVTWTFLLHHHVFATLVQCPNVSKNECPQLENTTSFYYQKANSFGNK